MKFETKGIGTTWWIEIFDESVDSKVFQKVVDCIDAFEVLYSRFLPDSLISQLNKNKVLKDFPSELYSMLSYCQSISELTDYRFNVCSGTIQDAHGYDGTYSFQEKESPANQSIKNGISLLTTEEIKIGEGISIDLGGIGKGWMVDTLKLLIAGEGYKYFSINGGGDIYATSNFGQPIKFFMENPFDTEEYIGIVLLKDMAFACSSPSRRVWKTAQGRVFHHLVNAQNGEPIVEAQGVFAYGKTALAADTASTCIFISPMEEQHRIADSLEVEFLTVFPDGKYGASKGFPGELHSEGE
jgi:FAD:protein FMN transferase